MASPEYDMQEVTGQIGLHVEHPVTQADEEFVKSFLTGAVLVSGPITGLIHDVVETVRKRLEG